MFFIRLVFSCCFIFCALPSLANFQNMTESRDLYLFSGTGILRNTEATQPVFVELAFRHSWESSMRLTFENGEVCETELRTGVGGAFELDFMVFTDPDNSYCPSDGFARFEAIKDAEGNISGIDVHGNVSRTGDVPFPLEVTIELVSVESYSMETIDEQKCVFASWFSQPASLLDNLLCDETRALDLLQNGMVIAFRVDRDELSRDANGPVGIAVEMPRVVLYAALADGISDVRGANRNHRVLGSYIKDVVCHFESDDVPLEIRSVMATLITTSDTQIDLLCSTSFANTY